MQDRSTLESNQHYGRGGGRASSLAYRESLELCEDFAGLEENTIRNDLMRLVKRVRKLAGFTPRMIDLLDYYMGFTRDIDWEEGSRPIVYQSIYRTAVDLGVTERQIQKLEKQLFEVGAITWNDSGNHKRQGCRDPETGMIQFAYGVDLTPLAYLKTELEQKLQEKQLYDEAVRKTKRQISWYRRQIRSILLEEKLSVEQAFDTGPFQTQYETIATKIRAHMDLEFLRKLLAEHKQLHSELLAQITLMETAQSKDNRSANQIKRTQKGSYRGEQKFVHYNSTNQELFDKSNTDSSSSNCFQKSVAEPSESNHRHREKRKLPKAAQKINEQSDQTEIILATGLQHITLKQALSVASSRFTDYLPLTPLSFRDVVDAAYCMRRNLHISEKSWREACEVLGRVGASVCVILTDRAAHRPENPVTKPAAYFKSMINKAGVGELRLHNSIFGILKK